MAAVLGEHDAGDRGTAVSSKRRASQTVPLGVRCGSKSRGRDTARRASLLPAGPATGVRETLTGPVG
jgi:hypothetical protein